MTKRKRIARTKEEISRDIVRGAKVCTSCGELKGFKEFYKQQLSPDGRTAVCIDCKAYARRGHHLKYSYGMSEEEYLGMIDEQYGCCAICGSDDETIDGHLHVDHDHGTGEVRGLLCTSCNKGLGLLQDNVDMLESAIKYLTSSKELRRNKLMLIKGIAQWAHIQRPDDRFPPAKYSITLHVDDETAQELRDAGLKVKKEGDVNVFKVKRNVLKVSGEEAGKPVVVDIDTNPFNQEVGNGSKVIVQIRPYPYNNNFGSGMSADLEGVQVIELVEYTGGGQVEFQPVKAEDL